MDASDNICEVCGKYWAYHRNFEPCKRTWPSFEEYLKSSDNLMATTDEIEARTNC